MTTHSPAAPSLREVPTASEPAVAAESLPVIAWLRDGQNVVVSDPVPTKWYPEKWKPLVRLSDAQAQINELTAELANAIQGRTEAHHWGDIFENRIKALTSERDEARVLERQLSEQMDVVSNELAALRTTHDALRQELAGAYELLHATEDKLTTLRTSQPGTDELMALADVYADEVHKYITGQEHDQNAAREALRVALAATCKPSLQDADQCRNDGANDIANLLDEAVKALTPSAESARLAKEAKRLVLMAIIDACKDTGAEPSVSIAARSLDTAYSAIDRLASLSASQAPAAPSSREVLRLAKEARSLANAHALAAYRAGLDRKVMTPETHPVCRAALEAIDALAAAQQPRGEPADNSRCKFASGGARCVSHCGDSDCAAMASTPLQETE